MSTIKVDTIATRTGSGNITLSNNVASLTSAGAISGTNLSASGTLAVTGNTTIGGTAAITGNTTVGGTLVNTGAITASAGVVIPNGQGIDFSATSDTGGVASEILDDYEEGTFTVQLGSDSSATLPTFANTGYYVKVGKIVHIHGQVTVSGSSSGGSNLHVLLPFTATNTRGALTVGINQALSMQTNGEYLNIIVELNANKGYVVSTAFGGGHSHLNFNNCGTGIFSFAGSFRIA